MLEENQKGVGAMTETKQERTTRQIELVETNNLLRSLKRLTESQGYGSRNWKRAMYHALCMSGACGDTELQRIREAIGLP